MRVRAHAIIPEEWRFMLPEDLHEWVGVPLLMKKALYGYTYSGKFLYEDQAEFLRAWGLRQTTIIALWVKKQGDKVLLVLQYSDDFLVASNDFSMKVTFIKDLTERFDAQVHPKADWYLQARIREDVDGNIILDQQRYSKSIVQRYLPNADTSPTNEDKERFKSALPTEFRWTKEDNSSAMDEVKDLEREFGFRYIEVVGSLNYLANTATEEFYAIRKACKHMNLPGRPHFKALLHLLHHIRCHPSQAIVYYRDVQSSPIVRMLRNDLRFNINDYTFFGFTDASHNDCDGSRSTIAYHLFVQGDLVDVGCLVPQPVPHSTAESEIMGLAAGAMAVAYVRAGIADILFNDASRPWTIPMFSDSQAAIAMCESDKPTKHNRHIDKRLFYARSQLQAGWISLFHVKDEHSMADVSTKNLPYDKAEIKLRFLERAVTDEAV